MKLEILYKKNKILEFFYNKNTKFDELENFIETNLNVKFDELNIHYDDKKFEREFGLSNFLTELTPIPGQKTKIKIIPQLEIQPFNLTFSFEQIENKRNIFFIDIEFGSSLKEFKQSITRYFFELFNELNYHIEDVCFYTNHIDDSPDLDFDDNSTKAIHLFKRNFFFLIKNSKLYIYSELKEIEPIDTNNEKKRILREFPTNSFNVIIQTYSQNFQSLTVYPEMTIGELKLEIEEKFGINPDYQQLTYLVYKLSDNNKTLKDYHLFPNGTIFLRGFYNPIVLVDFQNNQQILYKTNFSQSIHSLKNEILKTLQLDFSFDLLSNGKILNETKSLIDYDIQKYQTIYIK